MINMIKFRVRVIRVRSRVRGLGLGLGLGTVGTSVGGHKCRGTYSNIGSIPVIPTSDIPLETVSLVG